MKGDILMTSEAHISGETYFVADKKKLCRTAERLFCIRANPEVIDLPRFLFYVFRLYHSTVNQIDLKAEQEQLY